MVHYLALLNNRLEIKVKKGLLGKKYSIAIDAFELTDR
jgi:hypothetical protein